MVLGVSGALILLASAPAPAKTGPNNSWTQWFNGNWPANSGNPNCSPCVQWPEEFYSGSWVDYLTCNCSNDFFRSDATSAMDEWSGQQYKSPIFSEDSGSCSGDSVCVTAAALGSGLCGWTTASANSSNVMVHATVELNTQVGYVDGPATNGCDARDTLHHEIGHAFSEGHSSVSTALMFTNNNNIEHVDAYAQGELNAVYGPVSSGSSGGGNGCLGTDSSSLSVPCLSIATLKQKLLDLAHTVEAPDTMQREFVVPV
jgi:hypothetical protein